MKLRETTRTENFVRLLFSLFIQYNAHRNAAACDPHVLFKRGKIPYINKARVCPVNP